MRHKLTVSEWTIFCKDCCSTQPSDLAVVELEENPNFIRNYFYEVHESPYERSTASLPAIAAIENSPFLVWLQKTVIHFVNETSTQALSRLYEVKRICLRSWRLNSLTIPHLSWDFKKQFTEGYVVRTWAINATILISVMLQTTWGMVCALSSCFKVSPKTADTRPDFVLRFVL